MEEYKRSKEIFLDSVHEALRAKDDLYSRSMSFHESHVALLHKKVAELASKIEETHRAVVEQVGDNHFLVGMINGLNKAVLHLSGANATPEVQHDVMKLVATPEHAAAQEIVTQIVSGTESTTISMLKADIQVLRHALEVIVSRTQNMLEFKTKNAVEEIINESKIDFEMQLDLRKDPFLMKAAEQRRQDLAAISSAQLEIDRLTNEKQALTASLRKAEQDVVQMRLKMMERDSTMAIISKRIKTVEAKLIEETSTSAKRIEDAEKLAGEITKNYEVEVKRLRSIIEHGIRERDVLLQEIEVQKGLVQDAKDETEETRKQIEVARDEGYNRGRETIRGELESLEQKFSTLSEEHKFLEEVSERQRKTIEGLTNDLNTASNNIEELKLEMAKVREELAATAKELEERSQGPFGCAPPRTPGSREQSGNGLLTINPLLEEMVGKAAEDPSQVESAIRRLSTRLSKVHAWGLKSEKAKHPTMAAKVSSAIHDLAAGMLAVATAGMPPPPSPLDIKRRQEKRAASISGSPQAVVVVPRRRTKSTSGNEKVPHGFTEETEVVEAPRKRRSSKSTSSRKKRDSTDDVDRPPMDKTQKRRSRGPSVSGTSERKPSSFRRKSERRSSKPEGQGDTEGAAATSGGALDDKSDESGSAVTPLLDDKPFDSDSDHSDESDRDDDDECSDDSCSDSEYTPSSSENDGDDDMFRGPPTADASCSCVPSLVDKSVQADGQPRKGSEVTANNLRRNSTKLGKKENSVTFTAATPSESPSPKRGGADGSSFKAFQSPMKSPSSPTSGLNDWADVVDVVSQSGESSRGSSKPTTSFLPQGTLTNLRALEELEHAMRRHIQLEFGRIVVEIENTMRSSEMERHSLNAHKHVKEAAQSLAVKVVGLSPFVELKQVEAQRSFRAQKNTLSKVREASRAAAVISLPPADKALRAMLAETREVEPIGHLELARPGDTISIEQYNEAVESIERLRSELEDAQNARESLAALHEATEAQLEVCLNQMDDGGKRLLNQASNLPQFEILRSNGPGMSIVRVHSEEDAENTKLLLELITWFLLEGQRLVSKNFLPEGKPVAYEGRTLLNADQAQDRLSALLGCFRAQKEYLVEEAKKKAAKKKRKSSRSSATTDDEPQFLDSPTASGLEADNAGGGDAAAPLDDDDDAALLLDTNNFSKKLITSPRGDVRHQENTNNNENDESGSEDSPFVAPLIPRLNIPINPSLQKLELDAVIQPLLMALKKKLAPMGLATLLDREARVGLAVTLESAFDDALAPTTQVSLKELVGTKKKGLNAILSFETGNFLRDETHYNLLHGMFHSFPKPIMEKLTSDFNPELAYQLILRLSEWWDSWSTHANSIQQALEGRKCDQLRRLIELAEVAEVLYQSLAEARSHQRDDTDNTPRLADDLVAQAYRRGETTLKQLDHPAAEFNLNPRTKVCVVDPSQKAVSTASHGKKFAKRREVPALMQELAEVSEVAATEAIQKGELEKKLLSRASPIPTVATISPTPTWNPHAKKPQSKWESAKVPHGGKLPPLR